MKITLEKLFFPIPTSSSVDIMGKIHVSFPILDLFSTVTSRVELFFFYGQNMGTNPT